MSDSVGQINLDLVLQSKEFKQQLNDAVKQSTSGFKKMSDSGMNMSSSLSKSFLKLGAIIGSVFAAKQLIGFAKSCIELGSNLSEVQNVVDTVFTSMNQKVNEFAKNAANMYGLSENTAKKYVSNFGAMAEAFGFTEKQAYAMGTTLTGLAGDVASFYNISSDEAYNKLKAVFSGETESLKELGIVMTQTALDQYALANGFGKTTAKMSEAEKTALRYSFIQDKLSKASGDFAKTQNSWANQTRIAKLQWESFMASMGQGFINVLTPGLRLVNKFLEGLVSVGNAFSDITSKLMGTAETTTSIQSKVDDAAEGFGGIASGANDAADSIGGATQAMKELNRYLMKFDEINKLGNDSNSNSDPGNLDVGQGNIGNVGSNVSGSVDHATTSTNGLKQAFQGLFDIFKNIKNIFMDGFWDGLNDANFDTIIDNLKSIGESLSDIFTNPELLKAQKEYVESYVKMIGTIIGSAAKVGIAVGNAFTGGLKKYLDKYSGKIKKQLTEIFNIKKEICEQASEFTKAMSDVIADVLNSDASQTIIGSLIGIYVNGFLGVRLIIESAMRDIIKLITQPFIDNKGLLTETLIGFFEAIAPVIEGVEGLITNTLETIKNVYDEYIAPTMAEITNALSSLFGSILEGWNTYINPVLQYIGEGLKELLDNYIQPCIDEAVKIIGQVIEIVGELWTTYLEPIYEVLAATIFPVIGGLLKGLWTIVSTVFKNIFTVLKDLLTLLSDVIKFVKDVFALDWSEAWEDIKKILGDKFKLIQDIFQGAWDFMKSIWDGVGQYFSGVWEGIKNAFSTTLQWFSDLWKSIGESATGAGKWIWNGLTEGFKSVINGIKSAINAVIKGLNKISFSTPDWIPGIGGKHFGINIPMLANGGYVRANQPQLAVIGDNKREGEIVAPESKITDAVNRALESFSGFGNNTPQSIELTINLGDETLAKKVIKIVNENTRKHGSLQINT